jgi:uncharacterized protein with HEPN domain
MSRDELMYLQDMADSCARILQYTEHLTKSDLIGDQRSYDAVVRNLEIIGEAAKHLSADLRACFPGIEWRRIAGMRDMLSHAYFGIDNDILWDVVQNKIPPLLAVIAAYLRAPPEQGSNGAVS